MVYNNLGCGFTLGCKTKEITKLSDPIDQEQDYGPKEFILRWSKFKNWKWKWH